MKKSKKRSTRRTRGRKTRDVVRRFFAEGVSEPRPLLLMSLPGCNFGGGHDGAYDPD